MTLLVWKYCKFTFHLHLGCGTSLEQRLWEGIISMSFSAVHTVYCESGLTLCLWPRLNLTFEIQWPLRFTCFNSFPAHFIEYLLRIWSFFSSKIIWHLFENVSTTLSVVFKFLYDIWTIISNNYLIVMSLFGL